MGNYSTQRYQTIVDAGAGGGSTDAYTNTSDLPTSNVDTGTMAYVSSTNKLYMWNGSAWFNIAIVNQAPTAITGNQGSYSLASDGTPTVVTLVSTDPEGFDLSWSATTSGDTQVATVTNVDNVFTVTPSTDTADVGTLSITFSVTDGTNTETSVSSFRLEFLSALWDETVLSIGTSSTNALKNNTYIDRSSNSHSITLTGTASRDTHYQSAFHPYLDNWSVEFDGTNDYIQVAHESGFDFGTGDFTVELWANFQQAGIIEGLVGTYANNGADGWLLQKRDDGNIKWWKGSTQIASGTFTPVLGTWHHIAASRESGTVKLFIDGTQVASATHIADLTYTQPLTIGKLNHSTAPQWCDANISNLRIVKGTALYTSAFTPSTEALTNVTGTTFLGLNSNRFINEVNSSSSFTIYDTPKISAFNPFGQGSEYNVGENKGSLYKPAATNWNISALSNNLDLSGDFTIEMWWYPDTATQPASEYIMDFGSSPRLSIFWYWNGSQATDYAFYAYTNGYRKFSTNSNQIYPTNAWTHLAFVRTISDGTVRLYANGVFQGATEVNFPGNPTGDTFNIGNPNGGNSAVPNYWSDVKITPSAKYSSDFTPPTSPLGNTDAGLYFPFDNAGIFDKTGNYTLTPVGNASTSTAQTKFATTAIYFDGSGDYIQIPDDDNFELTGDFTIEFWAYSTGTATSGYQSIIGGNGSGSNGWNIYATQGTGVIYFHHSSLLVTSSAGDFPANQWNHVALTRSGSSIKMFVDGTQVGSTATSSATLNQSTANAGTRIGYDIGANGYYTGYLENIQILKGVAKYTTNFTPPTKTQGRIYQAES